MLTHWDKAIQNIWNELASFFTGRQLALATVRVALLASLALGISGAAVAQVAVEVADDGPPGGFYHVERPYNVEHGFSYHHASTFHEGYLRGLSNYIQSLGVYKLNSAQANLVQEQAEWANYQNVRERIDTFYDRRRIRQDYLAEQREIAAERDAIGKQLLEHKRATEYRATYKLSLQEIDRRSGRIYWPALLELDVFAEHREQLDQLFAHRARYGLQLDDNIVDEIASVQRQLKRRLRDHRRLFTARDYLAACDFLRGVLYEAQYPAVG